ncbi:hypothetical protein NPX13_g6570 [Xylaria arbuscula]|uniref:Ankyrin repeat protein n=1 Tax=Xylaria arbuscula TaxID=114810 RepID=A0A9W8TKA3_9PEZI|nr:hypothetical protein NPX13_g6570 [Xylaria arbuscula]
MTTPQVPSLPGPGDFDAARKGSNTVTGQIGDSSSKPLGSAGYTSQIPEATEVDSSDPISSQNNAAKPSQPEDFRTECRPVILKELNNPHVEIIAVHDLGESVESAWAYTTAESSSERTQKRSQVPENPEGMNKIDLFEAMLKAQDEIVSSGKLRLGRVQRWKDHDQATNDTIPTQQPSVEHHAEISPADDTGENRSVDINDLSSHKSVCLSSDDISPGPSKRDRSTKPGNWLTDPTMLAGNLERPRICAFFYNSPEPRQSIDNSSTNSDYNTSLRQVVENTAESILRYLKEREQDRDHIIGIPLVIIATGFGCLIIQKLIPLLAKSNEIPVFTHRIAGIIFMDAPNPSLPVIKVSFGPDKGMSMKPELPPPSYTPLGTRIKAFLESKVFDASHLWVNFYRTLEEKNLQTIWFYSVAQGTTQAVKPLDIVGIEFVKFGPIQVESTTKRPPSRFEGPTDRNYCCLVKQIKNSLLFKASSNRNFERFLTDIVSSYDLEAVDYKQRCPLHIAAESANDVAMTLLLETRHILATKRDKDGYTALHTVVREAVRTRPTGEGRAPFEIMIKKLVSVISEHQYEDYLKDKRGKSPWYYASADKAKWIIELRDSPFPTSGTQAARPKTIKELMDLTEANPIEKIACKTDAILTQFYISKNPLSDFLQDRNPDVHGVIYNEAYGITKSSSRNLGTDPDKEETCKWVHLPANNEKWVHDLFIRKLRCVDESTVGRQNRGLAPFDRYITPGAFKYHQTYEPSFASTSFTPSSSSVNSADEPNTYKRATIALFMPIFGFERRGNYRMQRNAMNNPSLPGEEETSAIIRAYFNHDKLPLHCRRTLDQFTYTMLDNTDRRDRTQVMSRWAKRNNMANGRQSSQYSTPQPSDDKNDPLLMVDQLWLWVLEDEQTVITSLPNTWDATENFNLVRYLTKHDLKKGNYRPVIQGPLDLANLIIRRSVDLLHLPGPDGVTIHECFQSSITLIAYKQIRQFKKFMKLVEKLNKNEIDQQQRAAEIMDIEDELKSIHRILVKQREVVTLFEKLIKKQHKSEQGSKSKRVQSSDEMTYQGENSRNTARENRHLAISNIETIDGMIQQAKRVREEVSWYPKLDLVAAWSDPTMVDQRSPQPQAKTGQRMGGKITLVFTLFTVCFLPLSFISSLFAIQIDAYPHDPQTGEVNWPLGKSIGLLVGISTAVILVIALVYYAWRIWIFSGRTTCDLAAPENKGPVEQGYSSDSDSDHSSSSENPRGIPTGVDGFPLAQRPQAWNLKWISILHHVLVLPAKIVMHISKDLKSMVKSMIKLMEMRKDKSGRVSMRSNRFLQRSDRGVVGRAVRLEWGNDTSTHATRTVGSLEVDLDWNSDESRGGSSVPMVWEDESLGDEPLGDEPLGDEPLGDEPLGDEQRWNGKESRFKSIFPFSIWTKEKGKDLESGKEK